MKQITIVSEDRPGVFAEITEAMAAAGVNIESLTAETLHGSNITIMTVDQYDLALQALAGTSLTAISDEALVVQVEDEPGALARIAQRFKDAQINLHSVRIIRRAGGKSIVAIGCEQLAEAAELVKDVLISQETTPGE